MPQELPLFNTYSTVVPLGDIALEPIEHPNALPLYVWLLLPHPAAVLAHVIVPLLIVNVYTAEQPLYVLVSALMTLIS